MINIYNDISNILIEILSSFLSILRNHPTFDMIIATFIIYDISDRHEQKYNLNNKIIFDSYSKLSKIGDRFCHQSYYLLYIDYKLGPNNISKESKTKILLLPAITGAYISRIDSLRVSLMKSLNNNDGFIGKFRFDHYRIRNKLNNNFNKLQAIAYHIIKDFKQKQIFEINESPKINDVANKKLDLVSKHLYSAYRQIEIIYREICQYK